MPDCDYKLNNCIRQRVSSFGRKNGPQIYYLKYDHDDVITMSLREFQSMATEKTYSADLKPLEIQKLFWDDLALRSSSKASVPTYAIDNQTTCIPKQWPYFNLSAMTGNDSILHRLDDQKMPGVNTPFVYFSMANAAFGLHCEDSNVASINIHHRGSFLCHINNIS